MDEFSILRCKLDQLIAIFLELGEERYLDEIATVISSIPVMRIRGRLLSNPKHTGMQVDQLLCDAKQEAGAQLCLRLRYYPQAKLPRDPISWAYRIIVNYTNRYFRRPESRRRELLESVTDSVLNRLAAQSDTTGIDMLDSIMAGFKALSPVCQKLLYLVHFMNCTLHGIAKNNALAVELFNKEAVPVSTVHYYKQRCEQKLREHVLSQAD